MVLVANQAIELPEKQTAQQRLAQLVFPENQQAVWRDAAQSELAWERINRFALVPYAQIEKKRPPEIITDNNMITEYKYGNGL